MKDPMKDTKNQKDGKLNQNYNGGRQADSQANGNVSQKDTQRTSSDFNKTDKIAPTANSTGSAKSDRR